MISRRSFIASGSLVLIVVNLAMISIAVGQYRKLLSQPGAQFIALGLIAVLVVYAVAFLWIGSARAFGIANTLDSALTYLVIAPIVALVVGGFASLLAQVRFGKRATASV